MPYLRAYRADDESDDGTVLFVASSAGVKRDGLNIDQSKWRLDNYQRNPVVLLSHDYTQPPIGTAEAYVDEGRLMARVKFDTDERSQAIAGKYERGVMQSVSVGWNDVGDDGQRARGDKVTAHELLDISAVSVPGDPDALAARMLRALRTVEVAPESGEAVALVDVTTASDAEPVSVEGELGIITIDDVPIDMAGTGAVAAYWFDEDTPEDSERGIAAEMVALFVPGSEDDESRESAYRALMPGYRHAGLTPPPFRAAAELDAMDARTWCGQFVSGELTRIGAVLSKRNKDNLREASRLVMGVLQTAEKAEPAKAEDDTETERAAGLDALMRALNGDDSD